MAKAINHQFPHLRPQEIAVWERFLLQFPDRFDSIEYDVRVGEGITLPDNYQENIRRMALALTKKRIDAVGTKAGITTLGEIAPSAGTADLGQLMVYKGMWNREHPGESGLGLMLLTDFARPDMEGCCEYEGVDLVVV